MVTDSEQPPNYLVKNDLRWVELYSFTYSTYVKRRWIGKSILNVLNEEFIAHDANYFEIAIEKGCIKVNESVVDKHHLLKDNDKIIHKTIINEPPVPYESITILAINLESNIPELFFVLKPCGTPIHPGAAYRYNTLIEIIKAKSNVHLASCEILNTDCTAAAASLCTPANKQNKKILRTSLRLKNRNADHLMNLWSGKMGLPKINQKTLSQNDEESNCNVAKFTSTCSCQETLKSISFDSLRSLHRLDRLTSGIVALSCKQNIAREFQDLFRRAAVRKAYLARVTGDFRSVCTEPIENEKKNYKGGDLATFDDFENYLFCRKLSGSVICTNHKLSKYKFDLHDSPDGKVASTDFKFICYDAVLNESLIICYPITGRTHQLRVQLQYLGHPISNDPCYGPATLTDWFMSVPHVKISEAYSPPEDNIAKSHASGIFLHAWKFWLPDVFDVETSLPSWC